jgi:hypothetical protein
MPNGFSTPKSGFSQPGWGGAFAREWLKHVFPVIDLVEEDIRLARYSKCRCRINPDVQAGYPC